MKWTRRATTRVLVGSGILSIVGGIGMVIYAHAVWQPRVEEVMQLAQDVLRDAREMTGRVQREYDAVLEVMPDARKVIDEARGGARLAGDLLERGAGDGNQMGKVLVEAGKDMRHIADSFAAILPDESLRKTSREIIEAAGRLRKTLAITRELSEASHSMGTALGGLSKALVRLEEELSGSHQLFRPMRGRIDDMQTMIEDLGVPRLMVQYIDMFAGLFVLLGIGLLGMAAIHNAIVTTADSAARPTATPAPGTDAA